MGCNGMHIQSWISIGQTNLTLRRKEGCQREIRLWCREYKKEENRGRKEFLIFQQELIAEQRQGEYEPEIEIVYVLST